MGSTEGPAAAYIAVKWVYMEPLMGSDHSLASLDAAVYWHMTLIKCPSLNG